MVTAVRIVQKRIKHISETAMEIDAGATFASVDLPVTHPRGSTT
jgi:hypothetical protein